MLRRFAVFRKTCASDAPASGCGKAGDWRILLHGVAAAARLLSVPLAALAAAAAGLVFLVLLPVCGIATLAEGLARACWRAALKGLSPRRKGQGSIEY